MKFVMYPFGPENHGYEAIVRAMTKLLGTDLPIATFSTKSGQSWTYHR